MKGTLLTLALCSALMFTALLLATSVAAQSSGSGNLEFIVEVSGITPEKYADAVRSTRLKNDISISEACVPAELIVINVIQGSRSLEEVKTYIADVIGSSTSLQVAIRTDLDKPAFSDKCRAKRLGLN
ncbi:MAG: hypothetical protein GC193_11395 [Cryomorphaceae bacterium]|nr:hypothetical protein [Cryomorphaceae bacterium]